LREVLYLKWSNIDFNRIQLSLLKLKAIRIEIYR
jgi:hypothetical protein